MQNLLKRKDLSSSSGDLWFIVLGIGKGIIVDSENKFTFSEIYVSIYDYGLFNRFTQTRA